jgi:cyanate permease
VVETLVGASVELRDGEALVPLKHDVSGALTRTGGVLSGPLPLALRLIGARSRSARQAAAIATIAGSILTRVGWIAAGRQSAART